MVRTAFEGENITFSFDTPDVKAEDPVVAATPEKGKEKNTESVELKELGVRILTAMPGYTEAMEEVIKKAEKEAGKELPNMDVKKVMRGIIEKVQIDGNSIYIKFPDRFKFSANTLAQIKKLGKEQMDAKDHEQMINALPDADKKKLGITYK